MHSLYKTIPQVR